jgi:hypothetical protein
MGFNSGFKGLIQEGGTVYGESEDRGFTVHEKKSQKINIIIVVRKFASYITC